jgi:hypothetical protein
MVTNGFTCSHLATDFKIEGAAPRAAVAKPAPPTPQLVFIEIY